MDRHKTLLILASVAILLAAVIGVGIWILLPPDDPVPVADDGDREAPQSAVFDGIEFVRSSSRPAGLAEPPTEEHLQGSDEEIVVVVPDETKEGDDPRAGTTATSGPAARVSQESGTGSLKREVVATTPAGSVGATGGSRQPAPAEATATPVSARRQPTPIAPTPSVPAPAPEPEPTYRRVTEYWIQVIATPSRDRVDQARARLSEYSLGGRITTTDVDGAVYYRLRVGPYTDREEADKFLEWIREIDGFADSYVSEEYPLRAVASVG